MGDALAVLGLLGAVYCLGGLHGLALAWTQEARCKRWARWVERNFERVDSWLEDDPRAKGPM